jgi:YegS/Rv2252/BmrU family lipid kinase
MQELHNALLIHNPNAGGGGAARRTKLDAARRILEARGILADLQETSGPGEATDIAKRASSDGRQLVIACGGDGTINEVVNGLANSQNGHRVPLALLPAGTANVLAKELELSWDIPKAAEQLARGEVRDIALGLATPLEQPEKARYFLSVAGAGPDGRITYAVDLELKARFGILAYWWQGAREVLNYKFHHFRVTSEGESRQASLVIVGRTKHYGGPFKITTEADLFEDRFELLALTSRSGLKYHSYLPTLWCGKLRDEAEGVFFWKSDRLVCESIDDQPIYAQVDGEPLARLPVEFRIIPRALRLLVPGPVISGAESK